MSPDKGRGKRIVNSGGNARLGLFRHGKIFVSLSPQTFHNAFPLKLHATVESLQHLFLLVSILDCLHLVLNFLLLRHYFLLVAQLVILGLGVLHDSFARVQVCFAALYQFFLLLLGE